MSTIMTLDTYSGRPNPSWVLSDAHEKELNERMAALSTITESRPSGVAGGLGYRGFNVRITQQGQPVDYHVSGNSVTDGQRGFTDGSRSIERFLLSRIPGDLRNQLGAALPK